MEREQKTLVNSAIRFLFKESGTSGSGHSSDKKSSLATILLWKEIKKCKLGFEFDQQVMIDEFTVDFFCEEASLAVKIDTGSLAGKTNRQFKAMQKELADKGITLLRFDDLDIKLDPQYAVNKIIQWLSDYRSNAV